ncbi:MAG: hypothetical protein P1P82_13525 [Bacteroidales bacterium]|nr:hypothetical protein [Bacteroidales bacterium]
MSSIHIFNLYIVHSFWQQDTKEFGAGILFKVRLKNYFYMQANRSPNHAAMKYFSRTWSVIFFAVTMFSCNRPGNDQPVTNLTLLAGNDQFKPS